MTHHKMPSGLWQRLNPFKKYRQAQEAAEQIYSQEVFQLAIQRECLRSDRSGRGFSILVFSVDENSLNNKNSQLSQLVRLFQQRLRMTDELGWFRKNELGLLLFDTSREGAYSLACNLTEMLKPVHLPDYHIYYYPEQLKNDQPSAHKLAAESKKEGLELPKSQLVQALNKPQIDDWTEEQQQAQHRLFQGKTLDEVPAEIISPLEHLFAYPQPIWKRALDITGASIALLLASPVLLPAMLYIKLVSPGPVFFKQKRIGYFGNEFVMWKLRSMHVNVDTSQHQKYLAELIKSGEKDKPMIKLDSAPQLIPYANIIRKSCVDELPQLINVLRGEMSMVGPRPPIPYEVAEYIPWHRSRFEAVPGMTGLWQVSGKNRLTFNQMVRLDIQYARKLGLLQDIIIILRTPYAIVVQVWDALIKPTIQPVKNETEQSNTKGDSSNA